ncbi:hypothetical protein ASG80_06925 [Agromyces sp. Soil535]|nr:hypothetical protein ASG80_06925 [Agromyces sp. Soil535]
MGLGVPTDEFWLDLPKSAPPHRSTLGYIDSDAVLTIERGDHHRAGLECDELRAAGHVAD